jgi:hypothetical protein
MRAGHNFGDSFDIFRFFLERGADLVDGSPFAVAFSNKIRTALGPFVELKRSRPALYTALQEQADSALRYFADKGDLKWTEKRCSRRPTDIGSSICSALKMVY